MNNPASVVGSLTIGGVDTNLTSIEWIQNLCEPIGTLQVQTTTYSALGALPYDVAVLDLADARFTGYVQNVQASNPPGFITVTILDEMKKAQDWYEIGNLVGIDYQPIYGSGSDVADWFNFFCDRMGINYVPATAIGRIVPVTYSWQYVDGLTIFKQLISFAGQGYQIKSDPDGVVNFTSYANVPQTGEMPDAFTESRIISDEWTRNQAIVYYAFDTVNVINEGAAVPYSQFVRRSIVDTPFLEVREVALEIATSLLDFYSGYMDVKLKSVADAEFIYQDGANYGGSLLISNVVKWDHAAGLVQELIFDRFCANMWRAGPLPNFLKAAYASTLIYHALEGTTGGLGPMTLSPQQESYEMLGVFCYTKTPGVPVMIAIYEDGVVLPGSSAVMLSTTLAQWRAYKDVTLLPGHLYRFFVQAEDMAGVRVGFKYRRLTLAD